MSLYMLEVEVFRTVVEFASCITGRLHITDYYQNQPPFKRLSRETMPRRLWRQAQMHGGCIRPHMDKEGKEKMTPHYSLLALMYTKECIHLP